MSEARSHRCMSLWSVMVFADLVIIVVIAVSAVLSFYRGFIREFLSLLAWAAALSVAVLFADRLSPLLEPHIANAQIRYWVTVVGLFVVTLIAAGLLNLLISKALLRETPSGTDRLLGLFLGAGRGAVVVAFALLGARVLNLDITQWSQGSELTLQMQELADWLWALLSQLSEQIGGVQLQGPPPESTPVPSPAQATPSPDVLPEGVSFGWPPNQDQ